MQRRNSDLLLETTNLKKRTLTATSSVNLDMTRSLSRTNLAISVSGSISNLSMVRSSSSSSFASFKNAPRDSLKTSPRDKKLNIPSQGAKSNVEKLKKELEASNSLISSLRAEVEQKEQIAALALNGAKVCGSKETKDLIIIWTCSVRSRRDLFQNK